MTKLQNRFVLIVFIGLGVLLGLTITQVARSFGEVVSDNYAAMAAAQIVIVFAESNGVPPSSWTEIEDADFEQIQRLLDHYGFACISEVQDRVSVRFELLRPGSNADRQESIIRSPKRGIFSSSQDTANTWVRRELARIREGDSPNRQIQMK